MIIINLILLFFSLYFAKEAYDNQRVKLAMLWAMLIGWNLHTIITTL